MALSPQERSRRMRLNMLMAMSYAVAGRSTFTPLSLFSAGEVGAWYDPSDFSTMFQDSAGTTPVTAVEQPVGLILDKSQRLVIGSELVTNGGFDSDTTWTKGSGWTISSGSAVATGVAAFVAISQSISIVAGRSYWVSCDITVSAGNAALYLGAAGDASVEMQMLTTGTYRKLIVATSTATILVRARASGFTGTIDNISVKELAGNHASQTTSTSRPVLKQDENGKYYLLFDGTDDSLATAAIDFSATDKVSVFAGVRKISDAAQATLVELTTAGGTTAGSFGIQLPGALAQARAIAAGSAQSIVDISSGFAAPITSVLGALFDISGDSIVVRSNGTQIGSSVSNQGTGNYSNAPLYIGSRAGTSLRLNGRLYSLIIRGALSTSTEITNAETWVNSKTKAF